MTPKEKSINLVDKFTKISPGYTDPRRIKEYALICVNEILNDNPNIYDKDRLNHKYWNKVKEEINKL